MSGNLLSEVRSDLEHVRLIHFSALIAAFTLAYVLFAAGQTYPPMASQLKDFGVAVEMLRQQQPAAIHALLPDYRANQDTRMLLSLRPQLRARGLDLREFHDRDGYLLPRIVELSGLKLEQGWSSGLLLSQVRAALAQTTVAFDEYSDAQLLSVDDCPSDELRAKADSKQSLILEVTPRNLPAPDSALMLQEESCHARLAYTMARATARFDQTWFSRRFALLEDGWPGIADERLDSALQLMESRKLGALSGVQVDLLGLKVSLDHVGVVCPLLIFICLLYMGAHLERMALRLATQHGAQRDVHIAALSPWIGTMRGRVPQSLFVVSLLLFCAAMTGLPLFVQWEGGPLNLALVASFIASAALNRWVFDIAQDVGRQALMKGEPQSTQDA